MNLFTHGHILKVSESKIALQFLSSYSVPLVWKSNLYCLESCQASCLQKPQAWCNWMLRCTLLESLARCLILGRSHDKNNHLCLRRLEPCIWVSLLSQTRNVEKEGRRASPMLPHKAPSASTVLQRSPWVQRWGQLPGTRVLTALLRSGLPSCHLPSSTPLYSTGRS